MWYNKGMEIKHLVKETRDNSIKLYFPPILDRDPVLAAQFLSIEDSKAVYSFLLLVFKAIEEGRLEEYLIMNLFLNNSGDAYVWLIIFFKELESLMEAEPIDIPNFQAASDNELDFPPPFTIRESTKYHTCRIDPVKIRLKGNDVINRYRYLYIKKCYDLEDFRDGYPAWYMLNDTTVFEDYNLKTNRRIRIDFRDGEFLYFVSGASDNWKQIVDVPLEMDYVISALLFRN